MAYERLYYGFEVELEPYPPYESLRTLISRDGRIQIHEAQGGSEFGGGGSEPYRNWVGIYDNSHYYVQLVASEYGQRRRLLSATARIECLRYPLGRFSDLWAYSGMDGAHLSEVLAKADEPGQVSVERFNDSMAWRWTTQIPGTGEYSIWFSQRADQTVQFEGYLIRKDRGCLIRTYAMDFVLAGPIEDPEELFDSYRDLEWLTHRVQHIEYDAAHRPVGITFYFANSNAPNPQMQVRKVQSYRAVTRSLDPRRVEFAHLEVPDPYPVKVYGSAVPHELRNGRLVATLDGVAIDEARGVGFRRTPFTTSRWYFLLLFGALVVVAGYLYFRSQKAKP